MKQNQQQPKQLNSPSRLFSWKQRFKELKAFKRKYGHCNVPRRYQPNLALGKWVSKMRQSKKQGILAEDRIIMLDALGFVWEMKRDHLSADNAAQKVIGKPVASKVAARIG